MVENNGAYPVFRPDGKPGQFGVPNIAEDGYDPAAQQNNYQAADGKCQVRFLDVAKIAATVFDFRKDKK